MTDLLGMDATSPWTAIVRRPPVSNILDYVAASWAAYGDRYRDAGTPLTARNETTLTDGLWTFLLDEAAGGRQPFHGEFYAELRHPVLRPDGVAELIGRTDIEWRLFGFPAFVIEFKILGPNRRTPLYLAEGVIRFVDGRYARGATTGAMCGLIRPGFDGAHPVSEIEVLIDGAPPALRCVPDPVAALRQAPSALAPNSARFDTLHDRDAPHQPVRLAHVFLDIPPPRPAGDGAAPG